MHKYRAIPTIVDGQRFASRKEADYFRQLTLLRSATHKANRVTSIEVQPTFELHALGGKKICSYRADFRVTYGDGRVEIVDVKGMRLALYRIKKKWVEAEYGIKIVEV